MSPFWTKKHPPHPPGAGRVKLDKNHPRTKKEPTDPLPKSLPRRPAFLTRSSRILVESWFLGLFRRPFFASIFARPFSGIFQNADDFWLPLWLPFGSLWLQFCTPFSDIFFDVIFPRFPSISRTLNPRKPWFYCSKMMIFAKPPNLNNLSKSLISYHILASFLDPFGTLFYIDLLMPFQIVFFRLSCKLIQDSCPICGYGGNWLWLWISPRDSVGEYTER